MKLLNKILFFIVNFPFLLIGFITALLVRGHRVAEAMINYWVDSL